MLFDPGYKIKDDRYLVIKQLGGGAFGQTYLVEDLSDSDNNHQFALKRLNPLLNNEEYRYQAQLRFSKEAEVLRVLGIHDRIPSLIDYFQENGEFYLVQEFIDGETLEKELTRKEKLTQEEVINLLLDVLEILDFIHTHSKIHRDIKPSNLIRRQQDGKLVLIDFGAVKAEITSLQGEQTMAIGTPAYMPIEQVRGRPIYSSDIYALGITAIYALTGKKPSQWDRQSFSDLCSEDLNLDQFNWHLGIKNIDKNLINIINKMIAPTTKNRYQSASDVMENLQVLSFLGKIINDRYEIVQYLGTLKPLGLGNTYLVKDWQLLSQPKKIIKYIRPSPKSQSINHQSTLEKARVLLQKEVNLFQSLSQKIEFIPKLLDFSEENNGFYIVYEFIEGNNLEVEFKKNSCWKEEKVINFLESIISILEVIHKQGVLHLDIQPKKIIKSTNNQIYLIGFSSFKTIANLIFYGKFLENNPHQNQEYIPPEQKQGNPRMNSDLYALGLVAIKNLTGESPKNLKLDYLSKNLNWNRKKVSRKLAKILNLMIVSDYQKRYQKASEIILALKKYHKKPNKFLIFGPFVLVILAFLSFLGYGILTEKRGISQLKIADLELKQKNYQRAIVLYKKGLNQSPRQEKAWVNQAIAYQELNQYESMLKSCEDGINFFPNSIHLWICKATALVHLNNIEDAIQAYIKAKEIEPKNFIVLNNLGDLWLQIGRKQEAISNFKAAIIVDRERSHVPWNQLGKLYYESQDYDESLNAYQEALKVKPDYLPSLIGLGNLYNQLKEYQKAINSYDLAIEINPQSYEAWFGKGVAFSGLQDLNLARESYEKALEIKPDYQAAKVAYETIKNK